MTTLNPSTKYYSNIQENLISRYLQWNKVSGSGSRNLFPGDIVSDNWIGECKTHMTPKHKIVFNKKVWDKLSNESISRFKFPVLFVDDGSQTVENTWCMFSTLPAIEHQIKEYVLPIKENISFYSSVLKESYAGITDSIIFKVKWNKSTVYISTLYDFKRMFVER